MLTPADISVLFVTPHAVEKFQERIASMSYSKARRLILEGIRQATNVKWLPDGRTLRVRTQKPFPFEFRAFCVFDETRGHFVVTTVVHGDSAAKRRRKERRPC